jgi:hypothetical protein
LRRIFLTIVTISQLFGALVAFSYFDEALKQTPFSTLGPLQKFIIGGTILIYLLGLVGSILIWLSRRPGIWLSLIHQLLLIPVFVIPNVFFWVLGDAVAVAVVVWWTAAGPSLNVLFNIGTGNLLQVMQPIAGVSYYGVNIFALICALYLNRLRHADIFE